MRMEGESVGLEENVRGDSESIGLEQWFQNVTLFSSIKPTMTLTF